MPLEDISSKIRDVRDIYTLAAFALGILLLFIRYLVDTFSDTNSEILNTILLVPIILTSLIVLASVICAIMDKFTQNGDKTSIQTGKFEVVDVDIIQGSKSVKRFKETWLRDQDSAVITGNYPLIDIKVRNPSNQVIFLKEIKFNTRCIGKLPDPEVPSDIHACVIPSKWDYNILFDPSKSIDNLQLKIAQEVPSNGVDRFVITVGQNEGYSEFFLFKYKVSMTLYYNNDESIALGTFEICIPTKHPWNILNPVPAIHRVQEK